MRRVLASLLLVGMLVTPVHALVIRSGGERDLGGGNYIPATFEAYIATDNGASAKIAVYDNSGNFLFESEIFSGSASNEIVSRSAISPVELVPGNTYDIIVIHSGYYEFHADGVAWAMQASSDSYYPDFPDPLPALGGSSKPQAFIRVKNSNGDVLIGVSDFSSPVNTASGQDSNSIWGYNGGYVCVTL